jgi:hypothetical protein
VVVADRVERAVLAAGLERLAVGRRDVVDDLRKDEQEQSDGASAMDALLHEGALASAKTNNVDHQVHAPRMESRAQVLEVLGRAKLIVGLRQVERPVAGGREAEG